MPAQSVLGQVGCLPGRTIAFRRDILVRSMPAFLRERFLGVFLEISDDRTLTNATLKLGYRTVYQSTSLVYTDAPTRIGKLVKQQYRWARGSQYNTLRMLPWMLRHARCSPSSSSSTCCCRSCSSAPSAAGSTGTSPAAG